MYRSFAGSICQKLATTIVRLETPVDVKLKLIPVFQNMHHDGQTVAKVRHHSLSNGSFTLRESERENEILSLIFVAAECEH